MNDPEAPTPTSQPMNLEPLETFVTDMAMVLAGSVTGSDDVEPFGPEQLGLIFFSAIAARARTQGDYNEDTDISGVIQLGVAVYGESVYATVNAALNAVTEATSEEAVPA